MAEPPTDFSDDVRKHDSLVLRVVLAGLGVTFVGIGLVGIFVPVLPTVPFMLLAAACFARSSTRVYNWILNHPQFGPAVREWRQYRSIPWRAKRAGLVLMAASFGISIVFFLPNWPSRMAMAVAGLLLGWWLSRIPSRDAPRQPGHEA